MISLRDSSDQYSGMAPDVGLFCKQTDGTLLTRTVAFQHLGKEGQTVSIVLSFQLKHLPLLQKYKY
jgi:hypothetical protein